MLTRDEVLALLRAAQWSPHPQPGVLERCIEWLLAQPYYPPVVD